MNWHGATRRRRSMTLTMWPPVSIFHFQQCSPVNLLFIFSGCAHLNCVTTEGKKPEELETEAQEEEEEAKIIQKRLAENLSEEDFDFNFLQVLFF